MSAPSRGTSASRARSTTPPTSRGRGSRGASRPSQIRGRGRAATAPTTNSRAEGLLQGLQAGSLNKRGTDNVAVRGTRGRGSAGRGSSTLSGGQPNNTSKTFRAPKSAPVPSEVARPLSSSDFMARTTTKFETLKRNREAERAKAIKDGFLADPDKKTTLDNAITPVGTCTEMCPAFERVERIVQRMVDKSEKAVDDSTMPDEQRMVKRFRRSAAGYDEQLPSDIRTPATLKKTLHYLLDNIIGGGERLASVHKFVWDRTRGIRNDFSIQQVTKREDVRIAVECLERIARFHILSLHQLSNPENLVGEQFDAHQDREQLNNTLLSLMYYYDDNRHVLEFPNEAEFRAYCIIFELQSQHPDLEDRMHSWPKFLLEDGRIKTAFELYAAAGNNMFDQGPLRPMTPFSLAQGNTGSFWSVLSSKRASYLMACVAEIYFGQVRFMALQALWTAATSAPVSQRAKNQDWTVEELANVLGFDFVEQAVEFCEEFGLKISIKDDGTQYLDVTLNTTLDKSSIPNQQVFSHGIVEAKRFRRTLTAVINGKTVPQAVREGLVVVDEEQADDEELDDDGESLFIPENKPVSANPFARPAEQASANPFANAAGTAFNPQASAFKPGVGVLQQSQPGFANKPETSANPFANAQPGFAISPTPFTRPANGFPMPTVPKVDSPTTAAKTANPFSKSNTLSFTPQSSSNKNGFTFTPQSTPPKPASQPVVFGAGSFTETTTVASVNTGAPAASSPFSFSSFTSQPSIPQNASPSLPISQPPTFPFLPPQTENTEGTAALGIRSEFLPASGAAGHGASMPQTISPPGMVTSQQIPEKRLQSTHPGSPFTFPVKSSGLPANGPPASSHVPTISFPRHFPRVRSPLVDRDPLDALAQHRNTVVLPSVETVPGDTHVDQNLPSAYSTPRPNHSPNTAPSGRTDDPVQVISDEQGPVSLPPTRRGFQWSDPTVPGYRSAHLTQVQPAKSQKPPMNPAEKAARKDQIVDSIARVAMTSQTGRNLMDELVYFLAPKIVNQVVEEHLSAVNEANFTIARKRYLMIKYGILFRQKIWRGKRRRRAGQRRRAFIQIERQYDERRRRESDSSAEKKIIMREVQESKRIKVEVAANLAREKVAREEKERRDREAEKAKDVKVVQVAGKRRKSTASEEEEVPAPHLDLAGRPYTLLPRHKRSRTETFITSDESDQESDDGHQYHKAQHSTKSVHYYPGRSIFSGRASAYGARLSSEPKLSRSIDSTMTDHFRLKARGVDPDTPFVPLTAEQVEYRNRQEEEEKKRKAGEPMPWKRSSILQYHIDKAKASSISKPPPASFKMPSLKQKADMSSHHKTPTITKSESESIEDLLAKLKSARQNQENDRDWFKIQTKQLEQELRVAEKTVQLHQTIERRNSSQTNSSGLMRSQAGYGFVPVEQRPGNTLSRTEQRIRRTGARGLATAPIGGTPGYVKPEVPYLERALRATLNGTGSYDSDLNGTGDHEAIMNGGVEGKQPTSVESKGKGRATENSFDLEEGGGGFQQAEEELDDEVEYYDEDDVESEEGDYYDDDEDDEEEDAGPSQYFEIPSRGASQYSGAGVSADDAIDLDSD